MNAGDLGQTEWTKSTLEHIEKSNYDVLILPGDLSYADTVQSLWDSFGRLVEPLASQRPWMVTQGNHEMEKFPVVHSTPFTSYNARWRMPFEQSASSSNLYYSFNVAGGAVHVVVLGSYTDFGPDSDQYKWVLADLAKVDRAKTPWLPLVIHAPWYNSNTAHQGESESVDMKRVMEDLVYKAGVDVVFAGHVHAYERFVSSVFYTVYMLIYVFIMILLVCDDLNIRLVYTKTKLIIAVQCILPLETAVTAKALLQSE